MLVQATARLRFVSIPPRKMRLVADMVKGLPVERALGMLNFTPRIAAHHIAKTVKSAVANALSTEGTDNLHPEDLYIKDIFVDAAPTAKRVRFQSMGRVFRIRKRHCHLTVRVEADVDLEERAKPAPRSKARKAAAADEEAAPSKKKTAAKKKSAATKKAAKKKSATKKKTAKKKPATKKKSTAKKSAAKKTATKKSEE